MAITLVQGNAKGTSATSTITVTLVSTPISGNVLIAVIGTRLAATEVTVSSITQTGVTWTEQISKYSGNINVELWLGVVGSGASTTITITLSATPSGSVADVCEWSGIATSGFLDKTATNAGAGYTADTGTTDTTTKANELWVGGINDQSGDLTTPTNGFTLLDGLTQTWLVIAYLYKIVSATGTANSGASTVASNSWVGCIATFKALSPKGTIAIHAKLLGII